MFRSPKNLFRVLAIAEVFSWSLLIIGLILRWAAGLEIATVIAGTIHGFVFISYGATAVLLTFHQRWNPAVAVLAIVSAIVPYATLPVDRWLARTGRLEGDWLLEVPEAPERRWYDAIMVWFLRRPWIFGALILAAIVAVYVIALWIGPPIPKN